MPKDNPEIEKRIQDTINALSGKSNANIAKTARDFDVPVGRLRHRMKGRNSSFHGPLPPDGLMIYRKFLLYVILTLWTIMASP